ncbi:MAG: hypothetical protein ACMG6E_02155 [Candidatus Roizmanbacteria bacterium]
MEEVTLGHRTVFVRHGILPIRIADIESLIGINMILIKRRLYGMVFDSAETRDVLKMIEVQPTEIVREYYIAEPWEGSRIYIEQHKNGISAFMVTTEDDLHLEHFAELTSF